jgi:hypothetical protein
MGALLPGSRSGYRTTSGAFKWIILIVGLGAIGLFFAFRQALKDVDRIYEEAGYPESSRFIPKPPPAEKETP